MAAAADQAEDYRKRLPALVPQSDERRSGSLMVIYGIILALVAGAAALVFGLGGHHERNPKLAAPPSTPAAASTPQQSAGQRGLPLPTPPAAQPTAPIESPAQSPAEKVGSLKLPPRPQPALEDAVPPVPEPDTEIATLASSLSPSLPSTGPNQPPLPVWPLIQVQPDPAASRPVWNPMAANGLPAPPPEKPPVPANVPALPPVDASDMIEVTADGLRLPKVSPAGWMPWIAYARRYNPEGPPGRVGVLMINIGASETLTRHAVEQLPGEVSLAFLPSTPDLNRWIQTARDYGHEAYLMLPVEDPGGPGERGIKPIETSVDAAENLRRLRIAMAKGEGYVGFVIPFPGPVSQSEATLRPVMQEISDRGLGIVEISAARIAAAPYRMSVDMGMGYARNASVLDFKATSQAIDDNLNRMVDWVNEATPDKVPRHAFGVVQPSAAAIDAIIAWTQRLAEQPTVSLLPTIGHFECRQACIMRVRRLQSQLRQ